VEAVAVAGVVGFSARAPVEEGEEAVGAVAGEVVLHEEGYEDAEGGQGVELELFELGEGPVAGVAVGGRGLDEREEGEEEAAVGDELVGGGVR